MPVALITGSAGLVGSAAVASFARKGWQVIGIDNDQRREFFGPAASTRRTREALCDEFSTYQHHDLDIRDQPALAKLFTRQGSDIDLVIHAAAQPSHDWAASAPLVDFEINAMSTLHLLELTRQHCPSAVFIFVSTNKVYGDMPNSLPLVEQPTRWEVDAAHEYAANGIDESMRVDRTLHSLFGSSKTAADILVQEYGHYFGMRTGSFRCSCITGGNHAAVEQHGFLAYLMKCAVAKKPYVIYGYKGKQVRDHLHAEDLVAAFEQFYLNPRAGEVYNMGGSRQSNCSVQEAIELCQQATGNTMSVTYEDSARKGDHIWWISDVSKFRHDYPDWNFRYDLDGVVASLYASARRANGGEKP